MPEPFKIYCAVYCVLRRDEKVFLMRRANTGYRDGYWALPSGHVEAGESLKKAIARELQEEAGLQVAEANLHFSHAMYRQSDRTYADYFFTCTQWHAAPAIAEPEKCDGAEWFALNNPPEKIPSELRQAFACIARGEVFSEIQTPGRE